MDKLTNAHSFLSYPIIFVLSSILMAGCDSSTKNTLRIVPAKDWKPILVSSTDSGENKIYCDMDFSDPLNGWISVVEDGIDLVKTKDSYTNLLALGSRSMLRTADGGNTWVESNNEYSIIDFIDKDIGWGFYPDLENTKNITKVGVTSDKGKSWTSHTLKKGGLSAINAISEKEAWAVSLYRDNLLHSMDGGAIWQDETSRLNMKKGYKISTQFFLNGKVGWIVIQKLGNKNTQLERISSLSADILVTTNGGKMFEKCASVQAKKTLFEGSKIVFKSMKEGWLSLGDFLLLHTKDGGYHWNDITPPVIAFGRARIFDFSFPNSLNGWVVGQSPAIVAAHNQLRAIALHTTDGGLTWKTEETGIENIVNGRIEQVIFTDSKNGWVRGIGGIPASDFPPRKAQVISFILKYAPAISSSRTSTAY